jgi:hypothetical protein
VADGRGREYERVKIGASFRTGVEVDDDEADAAAGEEVFSGSGWRIRSAAGMVPDGVSVGGGGERRNPSKHERDVRGSDPSDE